MAASIYRPLSERTKKDKRLFLPFLSVVPSRDGAEKAIRDLAVEIGSIFVKAAEGSAQAQVRG